MADWCVDKDAPIHPSYSRAPTCALVKARLALATVSARSDASIRSGREPDWINSFKGHDAHGEGEKSGSRIAPSPEVHETQQRDLGYRPRLSG